MFGVAHHQVDGFLVDATTGNYLGRLCCFNQCPKHKPELRQEHAEVPSNKPGGNRFDPMASFACGLTCGTMSGQTGGGKCQYSRVVGGDGKDGVRVHATASGSMLETEHSPDPGLDFRPGPEWERANPFLQARLVNRSQRLAFREAGDA